jgi:uncharacterized protein with PQ loop repeat
VIKVEVGEKKYEEKHLTPRRRENDFRSLLTTIASFLFIAFGFLVLLSPEKYPIAGLPTSIIQIIALCFMVVGLYVLIKR